MTRNERIAEWFKRRRHAGANWREAVAYSSTLLAREQPEWEIGEYEAGEQSALRWAKGEFHDYEQRIRELEMFLRAICGFSSVKSPEEFVAWVRDRIPRMLEIKPSAPYQSARGVVRPAEGSPPPEDTIRKMRGG